MSEYGLTAEEKRENDLAYYELTARDALDRLPLAKRVAVLEGYCWICGRVAVKDTECACWSGPPCD